MPKKEISTDYTERMADPSLTYYEKMYGKSESEVFNRLIHLMSKAGVVRLEAQYSGGHDEGGVETLRCEDKDGNIVETKGWEDELWQACDDVLSTKFYSWALGMSVYGYLHADLKERRIWTTGEQEVFETDPDPIEHTW